MSRHIGHLGHLARALVATIALALVVPAPAGATPPQAAPASSRARAATEVVGASTAKLRLLAQPTTVSADGRFTVFLSIVDAPTAAEVAVDIYDRATDPGDIDDPAGGPAATFPPSAVSTAADGSTTAAFTISLYRHGESNPDPAWGYRIDDPGVYPIRVRLRDGDQATLSVMRTALVRDPDADDATVEPTRAALLVDGRANPPADAGARAAGDEADGDLVRALPPVLDALDARPTVPATFSVTPDAVARMAADSSSTATAALSDLRRSLTVAGHDLLDAPYVDIDPASLVAAGLDGELTSQRDLGRGTLTELLEPPVAGTWRLDNHIDVDALDQLRQRGIFRTVLSAGAVDDDAGVQDPAQVPTGGTAVRVAAVSSTYVVGDAAPDDPVLAAHHLLASLAMTATDRTDSAEVIVDVDAASVPTAALDLVLDALATDSPWFQTTSLDQLLDAAAVSEAHLAAVTPTELGRYPDELTDARRQLGSYTSMMGKQGTLVGSSERKLTASAAASLDARQRRTDVDGVRQALATPFASIHTPAEDTVTLGARDATFPLTIESDLDEPAQVVIQLESNDRLEFPDDRIPATLDDEHTTVPIHVRTRASGDTTVRITVRTPDDGVILAESRYVVRSTAISGVGLLLTIGAAAFLAAWWARHWIRARRARGDAAADPV